MTQPAPTDPGTAPAPVPTPPAPPAPAPVPAPPVAPPVPTPAQVFPPAPAPVAPPPVPVPVPPPVPAPPPAPPGDSRDLSGLPQWAQAEIRNIRDEAARNRVAARTQTINNAVILNAQAYGINPAALLGSTEWAARAAQLDLSAPDYAAQLQAAVYATVQACPWTAAVAAAPPAPPPPTSGGEFAGSSGVGQQITEAQLAAMSPAEIQRAYAEGKLQHLM